MKQQGADVHILKLAAARRQLDAAIRMKFMGEDELAVHTVAAAALGILRDILEQRGKPLLSEGARTGLFLYASELIAGTLPPPDMDLLRSDPQLMKIISRIAEGLRSGAITSEADIKLNGRDDWRPLTRVANFLKHADRDASAHISASEVDNDTHLLFACGALKMLTGQSSFEAVVFHANWVLEHEPASKLSGLADAIASKLRRVKPSGRNRKCLQLIQSLKARTAE